LRRGIDVKSPHVNQDDKMTHTPQTIGWIGVGRMGGPMAERLLAAGHSVLIWNRTKSKAESLVKLGAKVVESLAALAPVDVLFTMVSEGKDLEEVYFGPMGVVTTSNGKVPRIFVDCSSISVEDSARIRGRLQKSGAQFVVSPVSGNGQVIKAGKLSAVVSGPENAVKDVMPLIQVFAPKGVSYVGDGDLARVCKIAHNVMLGVVIENLIEITLLANKIGVPRHAFLSFMNNSVMGSMFTTYKTPALVNLDWKTTFTSELLRKDLDLGLELGREWDVAMPVTAATREVVQAHIGRAKARAEAKLILANDFAQIAETLAEYSGMTLKSEATHVLSGLEP
jgi:3-hydroxyisobutyrate dehydrogenase